MEKLGCSFAEDFDNSAGCPKKVRPGTVKVCLTVPLPACELFMNVLSRHGSLSFSCAATVAAARVVLLGISGEVEASLRCVLSGRTVSGPRGDFTARLGQRRVTLGQDSDHRGERGGRSDPLRKGVRLIHAGESPSIRAPSKKRSVQLQHLKGGRGPFECVGGKNKTKLCLFYFKSEKRGFH